MLILQPAPLIACLKYLLRLVIIGVAIIAPFPRLAFAQEVLGYFAAGDLIREESDIDISHDFNGDGSSDIIVYYPSNFAYHYPSIRITDGRSGTVIRTIASQTVASIRIIDDVDGDGGADIGQSSSKIFITNGNTGGVIIDYTLPMVGYEDYFGEEIFSEAKNFALHITDLNKDGKAELVALNEVPGSNPYGGLYSDNIQVAVLSFDPITKETTDQCEFIYPAGGIASIFAGPDVDGDGIKDIALGIPNYWENDYKILWIRGDNCEVIKSLSPSPAVFDYGEKIAQGGDMNGDGVPDMLVPAVSSTFVYSGIDGAFIREYAVRFDGSNISGDLNFDRTPDIVRLQEILSGATGAQIGDLSASDFLEDLSFGRNDPYYTMSHPRFDMNGDNVPDIFAVISRPYEDRISGFAVISGTCPTTPNVTLRPGNGWKMEAGANTVEVSTKVCGLPRPGRYKVAFQGALYDLLDNGRDGDGLAGDLIYSTNLSFPLKTNEVVVGGMVDNEGEVPVLARSTFEADYNYVPTVIPYAWLSTSGGSILPRFTASNKNIAIELPFPMRFYGREVTKVYVTEAGLIGMGTPALAESAHARLPYDKLETAVLAPLWGGIEQGTGTVTHKVLGTVGARRFVITWEGFKYTRTLPDALADNSLLTFQVVFNENSPAIQVQYQRMYADDPLKNFGSSGTAGIQANPRFGVTVAHNEELFAPRTAIQYAPYQPPAEGGGNDGGTGDGGAGGGTGDGGTGGGDNGGGDTDGGNNDGGNINNVPANLSIALSVKHTPKRSSATVSLRTLLSPAGEEAQLNSFNCVFNFFGAQGTSTKNLKYTPIGSIAAQGGSRRFTVSRLASMRMPKTTGGKKSNTKLSAYLYARLDCPGATSQYSNVATVRATTGGTGTPLPISSWLKKLVSKLKD